MALKLGGQQIEALIEREYKTLQAENTRKIKEFKESGAYISDETNFLVEFNSISTELKTALNIAHYHEKTLKDCFYSYVGLKRLNLSPLPNKQDLREKLIIATIDCDNLQEVLKNAGFTLTI